MKVDGHYLDFNHQVEEVEKKVEKKVEEIVEKTKNEIKKEKKPKRIGKQYLSAWNRIKNTLNGEKNENNL